METKDPTRLATQNMEGISHPRVASCQYTSLVPRLYTDQPGNEATNTHLYLSHWEYMHGVGVRNGYGTSLKLKAITQQNSYCTSLLVLGMG